ncbi:MAG: type II secretion system GspH family protein, partial [Bifidobacteriaceae bacterium]|nr:type II secretion system GspH family protein [Bifidobacteriaceae bacterium]
KKEEKEAGFSLVELLIVVIIMGILAAIAIPLFMSQRAKAEDKHAQADVRTLATEISTFYADSDTSTKIEVDLTNHQYTIKEVGGATVTTTPASKNVTMARIVLPTSGTSYHDRWCVAVANPKGNVKAYSMSADKGLKESTDGMGFAGLDCAPATGT